MFFGVGLLLNFELSLKPPELGYDFCRVVKTLGKMRRTRLAMPGMQAQMTPVMISMSDQMAS